MSDLINYSWSMNYQTDDKQKTSNTEHKRFAFDICSTFNLPNNTILARSNKTDIQRSIHKNACSLLEHCTEFRTLDDHFDNLAKIFPDIKNNPNEIKQILQETQQAGLMVQHDNAIKTLSNCSTNTAHQQTAPMVFIPTCDRPEQLQQLLLSMHENCDLNHIDKCIVIDDSRTEHNRTNNQQLVERINNNHSFNIKYLGASKQASFIQLLTEKLPSYKDEINFLIGTNENQTDITPGRSRNIGLLLSVGKNSITLDDDIICKLIPAPIANSGVEISTEPREAEFYSSKEDWPTQGSLKNADPLLLHAKHLGMPLSMVLQKLMDNGDNKVQIESTDAIAQLTAESKVLITACGSIGDPGTASGIWMFYTQEASRKRFYESEKKYHNAKTIKNNWLGRSKYHLTNPSEFMSQMTGLCNSSLLPPYFPSLRNEDYLFGNMTKHIHPDSMIMDYPWAILHRPNNINTWGTEPHKFGLHSGFLSLISDLLNESQDYLRSNNATTRLHALAYRLLDQADTSPHKLYALLIKHIITMRTKNLSHLTQILNDSPNAPDYWKNDIQRGIDVYQASLTTEINLKISDINATNDELLNHMTNSWKQFGNALLAWPKIRTAAAAIVEQGFLVE